MSNTVHQIRAVPLTPQSWILNEWGVRLGILSFDGQQWQLVSTTETLSYDHISVLQAHQNWQVEFVQPEQAEQKSIKMIHNLPIKHTTAENIQQHPYVSYTKIKNSSVRFAAGYWAIRFNTWTGSWCPKQQTLAEYEHQGPFSTKLEMNTILAKLNTTSLISGATS